MGEAECEALLGFVALPQLHDTCYWAGLEGLHWLNTAVVAQQKQH